MKIEDAIKQKEFKNSHLKAFVNLIYTSNQVVGNLKSLFKPYGITHQQYNVLKIINGKYPHACTAKHIKQVMLDKTPDVTRLLDRLQQKGVLCRGICPGNRRQLDISITEKGRELLEKINPIVTECINQYQRITEEEAEELSRILDKMRG